ncbi:MAG: ribokinase [Candidatus Omnitrophica bacterium]|nr:ribokinase [Candidatus Omnitrophota bacterium]MCA9423628.1 ribokinase [Candidatus Omnitrophota bacterium]
MGRVVVVGSTNVDLVVQAPKLPAPGESVLGGVFQQFQGGKGANQAVAAARGGAGVEFIGRVGSDKYGEDAKASLSRAGVQLAHFVQDPELPTGIALIVVDAAGENQIAVAWGANGALSPNQIDEALEALETADVILTQLEMPIESVERVAELAHRLGKTFVLNPAPVQPLPDSLLMKVDIVTPNLGELGELTGRDIDSLDSVESAAKHLLSKGCGAVVVTQGAEGCLAVTPEESWWVKAIEVDARDTVGAGDCFSGNLAAALAEGLTLKEGIKWATVAAGLSVTRLGAQASMPARDEIERYLRGENQ